MAGFSYFGTPPTGAGSSLTSALGLSGFGTSNPTQVSTGKSSSTTTTGVPNGPLPDYVMPNMEQLGSELLSTYGQIGSTGQANNRAIKGAYNGMIDMTRSTGRATAASAANEFAARVRQQGGTAFNAGAARASTQMAFLNQIATLQKGKADALNASRNTSLGQAMSTAQALSQARLGYLSLLSGNRTTEGTNSQASTTLGNLDGGSDGGGRGGFGGGGRAGDPGSFTPGYIPSTGPMQNMTVGGIPYANRAATAWPTNWLS